MSDDLVRRLELATVASCSCETKSSEIEAHDMMCRYRLFCEAADVIRRSRERKTMTVPEAGMLYFELERDASYAAAARGELPTIRIGRSLRCPIPALEAMLKVEPEGDAG